MKNTKRILAGLGALLLFGLYLAALIFALIDHPLAGKLLMSSILGTVVIPCIIYGYLLFCKVTKNDDEDESSTGKMQ